MESASWAGLVRHPVACVGHLIACGVDTYIDAGACHGGEERIDLSEIGDQ